VTGGFEVDLPALDRLIRTLEEGAQRVREANAELGGYSSVAELDDAGGVAGYDQALPERLEVLGNEPLSAAAQRFATKWRYGLDKLDEAAREVLDRLHETRNSYQTLEDTYSKVFDQLRAPSGIAGVLGGLS
jgi:hypothetical protein